MLQMQLDENSHQSFGNGVKMYTKHRHGTSQERKIHDPVYGFIYLDQLTWSIIDTPVYQRLRSIKQLGTTSYVFQGANHTRFEHSLGVGHLAGQFAKSIYENQPQLDDALTTEEKQRKIQLVRIAGVVHDLGHGPFSHMFDNLLIPSISQTKWTHEDGSESLFRYLCSENNIELTSQEQDFIIDLIHGKPRDGNSNWMFHIVANDLNGMDVDKIDYLRRDSFSLGFSNSVTGFEDLMKEARVIDDVITFPSKYAMNIFDIYNQRYRLYKSVYLNRVTQAIDQMMLDILIDANPQYRFDQMILDPARYYKLNDSIIDQIDNQPEKFPKAQEIIKRLKSRKLYTFVSESIFPSNKVIDDSLEKIKRDIFSYTKEAINESEIYVSTGTINYGMKSQNPVDLVYFYKKHNPEVKFHVQQHEMSLCLPQNFSERFMRVFVSNNAIIQIVQEAFAIYCQKHLQTVASEQVFQTTFTTPPRRSYTQPGQVTTPFQFKTFG